MGIFENLYLYVSSDRKFKTAQLVNKNNHTMQEIAHKKI